MESFIAEWKQLISSIRDFAGDEVNEELEEILNILTTLEVELAENTKEYMVGVNG